MSFPFLNYVVVADHEAWALFFFPENPSLNLLSALFQFSGPVLRTIRFAAGAYKAM